MGNTCKMVVRTGDGWISTHDQTRWVCRRVLSASISLSRVLAFDE